MKILFIIVIGCVLFLIFLLFKTKSDHGAVGSSSILLQVDSFRVELDSFQYKVTSFIPCKSDASEEQKVEIFDSYIRTGLLARLARDRDYFRTEEFAGSLRAYERNLLAEFIRREYGQRYNLNNDALNGLESDLKSNLLIDYALMPRDADDMAEELLAYLEAPEGTVVSFQSRPSIDAFRDRGVQFYSNKQLFECCLLPDQLKQLFEMKAGEVIKMKDKSGLIVAKVIARGGPRACFSSFGERYRSQYVQAQARVQGDTLLNTMTLMNSIWVDKRVLSSLEISTSPMLSYHDSVNQRIVAKYGNKDIRETQVRQWIRELPRPLKSYFKNAAPRKNAVITLIRLRMDPSGQPGDVDISGWPERLGVQHAIKMELAEAPADTLATIKAWLKRWYDRHGTFRTSFGDGYPVNPDKSFLIELNKYKAVSAAFTNHDKYYCWQNPHRIFYRPVALAIDFKAIEEMLGLAPSEFDPHTTLATSARVKLTLSEFEKVLKRLSQYTREAVVREGREKDLITQILAQRRGSNAADIWIDHQLLGTLEIDDSGVAGVVIQEDDTVASFANSIFMTVGDLRWVVAENRYMKPDFFTNNKTDDLKMIMSQKVWLSRGDTERIRSHPEFRKKMENYRILLSVRMLLEEELLPHIDLPDPEISARVAAVVEEINNERIKELLEMSHAEIQVSPSAADLLGINRTRSAYVNLFRTIN